MWEVVENAADNIQGKKQFAKFTMSQIKEVKHFSHIYTFVTLTFRTEVILVWRWRISVPSEQIFTEITRWVPVIQ